MQVRKLNLETIQGSRGKSLGSTRGSKGIDVNKIGDNMKQDNFWIDIRGEVEIVITFC